MCWLKLNLLWILDSMLFSSYIFPMLVKSVVGIEKPMIISGNTAKAGKNIVM